MDVSVLPSALAGMLDARVSVQDAFGTIISTYDDPGNFRCELSVAVTPGRYFVSVSSANLTAGDLGRYTLTVNTPAGVLSTPTSTPLPTVTSSPTATRTTTPFPIATVFPSATPTPTPTAIRTVPETPTPSKSATPDPTAKPIIVVPTSSPVESSARIISPRNNSTTVKSTTKIKLALTRKITGLVISIGRQKPLKYKGKLWRELLLDFAFRLARGKNLIQIKYKTQGLPWLTKEIHVTRLG